MLSFFVPGHPQPEAKKRIRRGETQWNRPRLHRRDDDGSKRSWMETVRMCARKAMFEQKVKMIPAKVGVTVNYDFFFLRAKSNKDEQMVIKPDESRLIESIDDALEGVCYRNDMQINCHLVHTAYADNNHPGGVVIGILETMR